MQVVWSVPTDVLDQPFVLPQQLLLLCQRCCNVACRVQHEKRSDLLGMHIVLPLLFELMQQSSLHSCLFSSVQIYHRLLGGMVLVVLTGHWVPQIGLLFPLIRRLAPFGWSSVVQVYFEIVELV